MGLHEHAVHVHVHVLRHIAAAGCVSFLVS